MDSQESSPIPQLKDINSLVLSLSCGPTLTSIHDYWKNHCFHYMDVCRQNVSVSNTLFRFVISFVPRSRSLLISWLQLCLQWFWRQKKKKSFTVSIFSHLFVMKWWEGMSWSYFFECWVLSLFFHSPLSPSSKASLFSLCFLPKG